MAVFALSGAFAGVSYVELVGRSVPALTRRTFFVRRQVITTLGLLLSAVATRFLLGVVAFPDGYALLFALAAGFLLVATAGFWVMREEPGPVEGTRPLRGILAAIRRAPAMVREDANLRALILVANLAALGFTSIPLVTALAYRSSVPAGVGPLRGWSVVVPCAGGRGGLPRCGRGGPSGAGTRPEPRLRGVVPRGVSSRREGASCAS